MIVVADNIIRSARVEHAEPRKTVGKPQYVVDEIVVMAHRPSTLEPLSQSGDNRLGDRLPRAVSQLAG